jgi:prepilin-type processing-associated H-X9-DG protein
MSSEHPGGVNVAMGDGSVRWINQTISSWKINPVTGLPFGVTRDATSGSYTVTAGSAVGVWQKITTRDGNDVISTEF